MGEGKSQNGKNNHSIAQMGKSTFYRKVLVHPHDNILQEQLQLCQM